MEQKIKINLSAIMKDNNNFGSTQKTNGSKKDSNKKQENNKNPTSLINNSGKIKNNKKVSISLNNIDIHGKNINVGNDEENTLTLTSQDLKTEQKEIKQEKNEKEEKKLKNPIEKIEEIEKKSKKNMFSLDEIATVESKKEKEKENKTNIKLEENNNENTQKNGTELFSNYESTFKKEEDTILTKIKKLKNLPKTRPLFLTSIILITVSGIGLLFYIDPKTHSIENYKANILHIIKKSENTLNKEEPTLIKQEKINIGGLNIEIKTQQLNGQEIYNYNGLIFTSEEEMKKEIIKEVNKIKKEKLKTQLIDKFKK